MILLLLACVAGADKAPVSEDRGAVRDTDTAEDTAAEADLPEGAWGLVVGAPVDGLGNAVSRAGDVDADGDGDLLVAAYLGNRVCALLAPLPAGQLALDEAPAACFTGEGEYDYAGYGMGPAGDADGDGLDDLLVGSIGNSDQGANAGKVYLLTGPLTVGGSLGDAAAAWLGETAGDYAGVTVARAGDLTAEGGADYLVGATGYDGGGASGGRVYLVLGPVEPGEHLLSEAHATFTGLGVAPVPPPHGAFGVGDFVGDSVLGPGDLDGDGVEDAALGATGDSTLGANTGKAAVFYGPVTEGDHALADADVTLAGLAEGSYTGSPLGAAGDPTGDGLADLLVSADGHGPGVVFLVPGGGASASVDAAAVARFEGEAESDLFGFGLSSGDADGDGVDDLLIGAPGHDGVGTDSGAGYLFPGPLEAGTFLAAAAASTRGARDGERFGSALAVLPDQDDDGDPDLAIGAYNSDAGGGFSGALYLIDL